MQIQTIPSALFSLRTCCALAWFGISQTHHEGSILASKGRCQSNSVVRPLALTLRRTGPLKCLLTVFQSLNSGIHTRRKRCSFVLAKFLSPSGFSMFCKSCIYRYTTTPFPTKRCRNIEQWSAFQICCLVGQ